MESDTIVAVVTPPGEGGIGVVRLSGPLCQSIAKELFPGLNKRWPSHRLRQGRLIDPASGHTIDQALGVLMIAPRSYTGEDVFELHCHGSPLVLERSLSACLRAGCRPAKPGEFTLRAFLNGRLDLTQAEAVLDVVRARSNLGLEVATRQLCGWLAERVEPLRSELIGILAHMEAMVDFVEDDLPPALDTTTRQRLLAVANGIDTLLAGASQGIVLREGATLAIVGSPNVGKSSIMNALLGLDRSIVTPIAGTTRDTVEEQLQIDGVPFRAIDTAGFTRTTDVVEQIGVERSRQALAGADVVLLVLDQSRAWNEHDALVVEAIDAALRAGSDDGRSARLVVSLNKADLPAIFNLDGRLESVSPLAIVSSSTVSPTGVETLRAALARAALGDVRHDWIVGNVRHQEALRRAVDGIRSAEAAFAAGLPLDLLSFDVRASAQALGEISGVNVDDELLDRIFRDFCIGK